ncbi:hypothetical protein, partial [Mesorhizobium sp. M5C.F.Ca.IN.020.32.2.1]|uniref:hypothetical protein n=1 Tax=Mesorhizobium sp. M5C.F.Ca.IN.020.32.2.1 TaxID=2496771 RepID=UPI0013E3CDD7
MVNDNFGKALCTRGDHLLQKGDTLSEAPMRGIIENAARNPLQVRRLAPCVGAAAFSGFANEAIAMRT